MILTNADIQRKRRLDASKRHDIPTAIEIPKGLWQLPSIIYVYGLVSLTAVLLPRVGSSLTEFLNHEPRASTATEMKDQGKIEKANIRMRETEDYEHFLGGMTLALSNYIIVVMREPNFHDQRFLFHVVRRWYDYQDHEFFKCQDVFVIHNFRTTHNPREREELFLVRRHIRNILKKPNSNPLLLYVVKAKYKLLIWRKTYHKRRCVCLQLP